MGKEKKGVNIKDRIKKASRRSFLGYVGGIKGRIILFLLTILFPLFISFVTLAIFIVLMSGAMTAMTTLDEELAVEGSMDNVEVGGEESEDVGRSVEVPEELRGKLLIPAGNLITSPMGDPSRDNHLGVDISGPRGEGKNIRPMYPGTVERSYLSDTFGNAVVLKHDVEGTEMYSIYAHMKGRNVSNGDSVGYNTILGEMGTTGRSTGIHLHFEVHDSSWVNIAEKNRMKSVLNPADYIMCSDSKTMPKADNSDVTSCLEYRMGKAGN